MNLKNRKIIITAGGTIEPIDAVRYIGNFSSGKMGIAFVKALKNINSNIVLIHANLNTKIPGGIKAVKALTVKDMYEAIKKELTRDAILIMTAAVSDFKVKKTASGKIKKNKELILHLIPTIDILKKLSKQKTEKNFFIGFALESEDLIKNAEKKLKSKKLDMIIANSINKTNNPFGSDYNKVTVITSNKKIEFPKIKKTTLAKKIVRLLEKGGTK